MTEVVLDIFFFPIRLCIAFPYLAFLPAFLFGLFAYIDLKGRGSNKLSWGLLWPSIIWSIYGIYEILMYSWSKTVDIPIRVDLLLVTPVIYLVTFMGINAFLNMQTGKATKSRFADFCPRCIYFQEETRVCKKLHFNVFDYPNKFVKKCNGNYFEKDTSRTPEL